MSRQPHPYNQILQLLKQLHTDHPRHTIGMHLSTALDAYGDLWTISDKEFLFALEKYQAELEMDRCERTEEEIEKIISEGQDIENILNNEEDNGYEEDFFH